MRKHPHSSIHTRKPKVKAVKENKSAMSGLFEVMRKNCIDTMYRFEMRKINTKKFQTNRYFRAA